MKFIIAIICLRNNLFISIFIWILLILSYISFLQNWWRRRQLMQVKILHYLDNITKGNKNYIYYLNDIAENINIEAIYYYHHKNNLFLRMLQNWSKQRPTNRTLYQNYQFQYISIHSIIFYFVYNTEVSLSEFDLENICFLELCIQVEIEISGFFHQ